MGTRTGRPRLARRRRLSCWLVLAMTLARGFICFFRQLAHLMQERWGLAAEQPIVPEGLYSRPRTERLYRGRPNDRTSQKRPAEERAWLGHDQIGLGVLPAKRRLIQVRKHERGIFGIGQRSQRIGNCG